MRWDLLPSISRSAGIFKRGDLKHCTRPAGQKAVGCKVKLFKNICHACHPIVRTEKQRLIYTFSRQEATMPFEERKEALLFLLLSFLRSKASSPI